METEFDSFIQQGSIQLIKMTIHTL